MGRDASEEAGVEEDGQLMRLLAVVVAEVSFGLDRARWMESRPVS